MVSQAISSFMISVPLLWAARLAAITASFVCTYRSVPNADLNSTGRFANVGDLDPGPWSLYLSRIKLSLILRKVLLNVRDSRHILVYIFSHQSRADSTETSLKDLKFLCLLSSGISSYDPSTTASFE